MDKGIEVNSVPLFCCTLLTKFVFDKLNAFVYTERLECFNALH